MTTAIGQRVIRLREAPGLSQYALAKRAGLSRQALSYLGTGDRDPTWESVQRIAAGLGVPLETLADPDIQATDWTPSRPGPKPGGERKD
jgi:transcriptional regulator with XRE-family HTH domain